MEEMIRFATDDLLAISLVFFRMSSLLLVMPFFGGKQISMQVRIAFIIAMTFLLYKTIDLSSVTLPTSSFEYFILIAKEMGIGVILGTLASLAFFALQFGGEIIGMQMGLARARALDPLSDTQIPAMGQFLTFFIMTIFLLMNGHHFILKVFVDSFSYVPIRSAQYTNEMFSFAIKSFNVVLYVGLQTAIPIMCLIFTMRVTFMFMARLVPQMNIFILSLPFQILGGLVMTAICLPLFVVLFSNTFDKSLENMYRALILM